jgi:hypothetical protein
MKLIRYLLEIVNVLRHLYTRSCIEITWDREAHILYMSMHMYISGGATELSRPGEQNNNHKFQLSEENSYL